MSRALLIATSFPPAIGGLELYVEHVARALEAPVDVLAGHSLDDPPIPCDRGYAVHGFARVLAPLGHRDAFRTLSSHVAAYSGAGRPMLRPDRFTALLAANRNQLRWSAVHARALPAHGLPPRAVYCGSALPAGVLARLISRHAGVPYAIFAHGAEVLRAAQAPHHRALLGAVLQGAARVAAVSSFTAGVVQELGVDPSRIVRTPPGIDPAPFTRGTDGRRTRERLGLEGRRVILTHGRLDPRKGHDVVIDALGHVAKRHPDVSYVISGTGPTRDALAERAAREGVADRVVFAGRIATEDVADLYAACDVFAMPSRRVGANVEGFGIVALEAAAAERAVIAGRSGGVADAVEDGVTGMLVDAESVDAVGAALRTLLDDHERRHAMGRAGRARVIERFDLRAFGARIKALEAGLAEERQRLGETRSSSRLSG